jgi:hypothetical protein
MAPPPGGGTVAVVNLAKADGEASGMTSREGMRTPARLTLVIAVAALSTLTACGGGSSQAEKSGAVTGHLLSPEDFNAGPKSLSGTLTASNQSGHVVAVVKVPASGKFSLRLPVGSYALSAVLDGSKTSCRGLAPGAKVKSGATTVANVICGTFY